MASDKKYHHAEYQVEIDLSREQAWAKLKDISQAHQYVPGIIATELNTAKTEGVGASRRVVNRFMAMDETVVEWREGKGFKIRLHKGKKPPPMFKEAYFTYTLCDGEDGKTLMTTAMDYIMPLGSLGNVATKLFIHRIVQSQIRDVAISARLFYESGERTRGKALASAKKALP